MKISASLRKLLKQLKANDIVDDEISADIYHILWQHRAVLSKSDDCPPELKHALWLLTNYEQNQFFPPLTQEPQRLYQSLPWVAGLLVAGKQWPALNDLFTHLQREESQFSGDFILRLEVACGAEAALGGRDVLRETEQPLERIVSELFEGIYQAIDNNENRFNAFLELLDEHPSFYVLPQFWENLGENLLSLSDPLKLRQWLTLLPQCIPLKTPLSLNEQVKLTTLHLSVLRLLSDVHPLLQEEILRALDESWQKMHGFVSDPRFMNEGVQALSTLLHKPLAAHVLTQLNLVSTAKKQKSEKELMPVVKALWINAIWNKEATNRERAQADLIALVCLYPEQVLSLLNTYINEEIISKVEINSRVEVLKLLGRLPVGNPLPTKEAELDLVTLAGRSAYLSKLSHESRHPELRLAGANALATLNSAHPRVQETQILVTPSKAYMTKREGIFNQGRSILENYKGFEGAYVSQRITALSKMVRSTAERARLQKILLPIATDRNFSQDNALNALLQIHWEIAERRDMIQPLLSAILTATHIDTIALAIHVIGQIPWNSEEQRELLQSFAKNFRDPYNRGRTIETSVKIPWKPDIQPDVLRLIIEALIDTDRLVSRMGVIALGQISWHPDRHSDVLSRLRQAMGDGRPIVREDVVAALGQIDWSPDKRHDVIHFLQQVFADDGYVGVKKRAIKVLRQIIRDPEEQEQLFKLLCEALVQDNKDKRHTASGALKEIPLTQKQASALLQISLRAWPNVREDVREDIVKAVREIAWDPKNQNEVLRLLQQAITDPDSHVCLAGFEALGQIPWHQGQQSNLLKLFIRPFERASFLTAAINSLTHITWSPDKHSEILHFLDLALSSDKAYVRSAGVEALGKIAWNPNKHDDILRRLRQAAEDDTVEVRVAVAKAVGQMAWGIGHQAHILMILQKFVTDASEEVRKFAINSIGHITWASDKQKNLLQLLQKAMADTDENRVLAVKVLGGLTWHPDRQSDVMRLFRHGLFDDEYPVRRAVVEVLGQIEWAPERPPEVQQLLLQAWASHEYFGGYSVIKILVRLFWEQEDLAKRTHLVHLLFEAMPEDSQGEWSEILEKMVASLLVGDPNFRRSEASLYRINPKRKGCFLWSLVDTLRVMRRTIFTFLAKFTRPAP